MKHRISITIGEETLMKLKEKLRTSSSFRNQSHLVECAVKLLIDKEDGI